MQTAQKIDRVDEPTGKEPTSYELESRLRELQELHESVSAKIADTRRLLNDQAQKRGQELQEIQAVARRISQVHLYGHGSDDDVVTLMTRVNWQQLELRAFTGLEWRKYAPALDQDGTLRLCGLRGNIGVVALDEHLQVMTIPEDPECAGVLQFPFRWERVA